MKTIASVTGSVRQMLALISMLLLLASCSNKGQESATAEQYTCPMHPTVMSSTQGSCPVCGMDLVRKARAGEELKISEDIARMLQSPDESVVADVPTIRGTYRKMITTVGAQGVIAYDTRHIHTLPARVGGRLERVYLRYAFQPVKRGQRIADIYSPEMLTAQRELLFLVSHDPGNESRVKAAQEKLLLLGATPAQLEELLKTGTPNPTFAVYSEFDGYVIEPQTEVAPGVPTVTQAAEPMGATAMQGSPAEAGQPTGNQSRVREGDYVTRGQTLFTLADRQAVRAELRMPLGEAARVRAGDLAVIYSQAGDSVAARVDMVQPFFSEGEQFLAIRVYLSQGDWRIGQLVRARLKTETAEALWLPSKAVYDLGTTQVVFVKERGVYKPRTVATGLHANGWIEILSGLASMEEVAGQAAYLVDSESFIKTRSIK